MSWKVTKMFCEEDSKSSHKASAIANSSQTKTQVSNFQEKSELFFGSLFINGGFEETKKRFMKYNFDLLLRSNEAMKSKSIR